MFCAQAAPAASASTLAPKVMVKRFIVFIPLVAAMPGCDARRQGVYQKPTAWPSRRLSLAAT
ncbi:Uncharacterised protein [Achromobacter ruhlandii]|nr:Uncharacterised protein [Achromobacter ruhlandii]CUK21091.1 Uncharacterised protein [Achromobacter ruhlandii]